jgi:hypothetical protein
MGHLNSAGELMSNPIINANLLKRLYLRLHQLVRSMVIHLTFFTTITTSTTLVELCSTVLLIVLVCISDEMQASVSKKASSDVRGMTDDVIIKI